MSIGNQNSEAIQSIWSNTQGKKKKKKKKKERYGVPVCAYLFKAHAESLTGMLFFQLFSWSVLKVSTVCLRTTWALERLRFCASSS